MTTDRDHLENPGAVIARDHGGFTIDRPKTKPKPEKNESEEP